MQHIFWGVWGSFHRILQTTQLSCLWTQNVWLHKTQLLSHICGKWFDGAAHTDTACNKSEWPLTRVTLIQQLRDRLLWKPVTRWGTVGNFFNIIQYVSTLHLSTLAFNFNFAGGFNIGHLVIYIHMHTPAMFHQNTTASSVTVSAETTTPDAAAPPNSHWHLWPFFNNLN